MRQQLASPLNWLVIAAFALIAGAAFVHDLDAFLDVSAEALTRPPLHPININQLLIRPFLVQVGLAALLVLPIVTARARFLGAYAVYKTMLVPSMVLVLALFAFGSPEWGTIVTGYVGLLLIGAAFIAVGTVMSSLTATPFVSGTATFSIALLLVTAAWLATSGTTAAQPFFARLSVAALMDDFAKGIVDTATVIACFSVVAFSVMLTRAIARASRPDSA